MYDLTCADPAIMYDAGRKNEIVFLAKGRPEFFNIWKKEKHRKYIYVVKKERLDDALLQCLEFRLIICINNWKNILGAGARNLYTLYKISMSRSGMIYAIVIEHLIFFPALPQF